MSGQSFTFVDAISAIRARFPAFQFSNNPIHSQPVGKEQTTPGRPRQYVRRTLSYLLVPLIAVAILGEDEARHYFPPLPTTGRGASPATRTAQFTFTEAVLALRQIMVSGTVAIHRADILPSPKDGRTLYFSERLQTGLFDEINNRFPQLYAGITRWIEERFQEELRSWQTERDPQAVIGTAPAPQGGSGSAPAAVQRNACVVPAIQQQDIFASVPQSHLSVSTAAPAVNHHPIAGAQLPCNRQPYASPPHYAGGYGSQQPT